MGFCKQQVSEEVILRRETDYVSRFITSAERARDNMVTLEILVE